MTDKPPPMLDGVADLITNGGVDGWQAERDRAQVVSALRALPDPHHEVSCPPVVYDLPDSPIASVMAALRGGESRGRAIVVAAIVLIVLLVTFLFAGA